jgi:ribosomal protein L27
MTGGFSTPKKDKGVKVSAGQDVKAGQILVKGMSVYKAGQNVKGLSTLFALCSGKVNFSRTKTSHGKFRTFVHILPSLSKPSKK